MDYNGLPLVLAWNQIWICLPFVISIGRKKSFWNVYAKWGNNCHFYSSVVYLEFKRVELGFFFFTGNSAMEKWFIFIIIIIIMTSVASTTGAGRWSAPCGRRASGWRWRWPTEAATRARRGRWSTPAPSRASCPAARPLRPCRATPTPLPVPSQVQCGLPHHPPGYPPPTPSA